MKRKRLVALFLTLVLFTCFSIQTVASDSTTIKFTAEKAIEMAERFAASIHPEKCLEALNAVKFYDESGQAIGYIVDYYNDKGPAGYIIFDSTHTSLISEYSFDEKSKNPYEAIVDSCNISEVSTLGLEETKIYKLSPFTYAMVSSDGNEYINNYGERIIVDNETTNYETYNSSPSTWDDIFLEIDVVYEDYTMVTSNHLPEFIAVSQETIMEETNHYACAVTALYACAMYYGIYDYYDMYGDYIDLWEMTSTTTIEIRDGVVLGTTTNSNVGPGFIDYAASRGLSSISYRLNLFSTYSFFTNCIDDQDMAVALSSIYVNHDGEVVSEGHSMAVEGYATIRGNTSGNTIRTLMVFDGWTEGVRFLNYDFENWNYLTGVAFNS